METLWGSTKALFLVLLRSLTPTEMLHEWKPSLLLLTTLCVSAWTIPAATRSSSREISSSEITPLMVNHTNDRLSKLAEREARTVQIKCVTGSKSTVSAKDRAHSCSSPRTPSLRNWASFPAPQSLQWFFSLPTACKFPESKAEFQPIIQSTMIWAFFLQPREHNRMVGTNSYFSLLSSHWKHLPKTQFLLCVASQDALQETGKR